MVAAVVEQERVVPVRRVDLGVGDGLARGDERPHDLARARRREAPVARERGDEESRLRGRERAREVAARLLRRIEIVERLRHQ